jgi:excisionase family DNA binding protein
MLTRDMEEQPATLQGVTVAEAAAILGVSTATVRRMVKRGQLEGQRVIRPQGSAFVVMMPAHASGITEDTTATQQSAGVTSRDNASPVAQLTAWSETFLVPLVAALERSQATVREQAETIGRQSERATELERENGRLIAERDAASAAAEATAAEAITLKIENQKLERSAAEQADQIATLRVELAETRGPPAPRLRLQAPALTGERLWLWLVGVVVAVIVVLLLFVAPDLAAPGLTLPVPGSDAP